MAILFSKYSSPSGVFVSCLFHSINSSQKCIIRGDNTQKGVELDKGHKEYLLQEFLVYGIQQHCFA